MRKISMLIGGATLLAVTMPLHAQKARRTPPVLVPPSAPAAAPAADTSHGKAHRAPPTLVGSAGHTPASVAPQSTRPAPAGPVASFTAGLAIAPYAGSTDDDRTRYLRRFTTQLDSATAMMVSVFRNTSGQALAGADAPTALSARERERWGRCRDLHFDIQSYAESMHDLVEGLPEGAAIAHTGVQLDSALTALHATSECDNIASMISAPGRWTPWGQQYASSARNFYRDWYVQVRDVADRNRALVIALNSALPAASRIAVPPALPRTPPYAGAGPR